MGDPVQDDRTLELKADPRPAAGSTDRRPLLHGGEPIEFDRVDPSKIESFVEKLLREGEATLVEITGRHDPSYDELVRPLDDVVHGIERTLGIVSHLESVRTTPALRALHQELQPRVARFLGGIPRREELHRALLRLQTSRASELTATQRRRLDLLLDDFRRHGVGRRATDRERLADIDAQLARDSAEFSRNVLDATRNFELHLPTAARSAGLPASILDPASSRARRQGLEGWVLALDEPTYISALSHAHDRSLREELYRAHNTRATAAPWDNLALVGEILRLRREKARRLGFANFSEFALDDRMASSPAAARGLLAELRDAAAAAFARENASLTAFARRSDGPAAPPIAPWDLAYYAHRQRRAVLEFDDEELRPYFALPAVIEGLFAIAGRLFGVCVQPTEDLPRWHADVAGYRMTDEDGTELGTFYLDLHPRETKNAGAWMQGLVTGESDSPPGTHVAVLAANLPVSPTPDQPTLLAHRDVRLLFHEFGHLLHHMLSKVALRALGGTRVPWDFVEVPSQLLEQWAWEREALDLFARHTVTGGKIPDRLYAGLRRSRTFRAANAMMRQLGFAELDLALHIDFDPEGDEEVTAFARRVLAPYSAATSFEGYAMVASFTHLFAHPVGYGSGYYSYKWSDVLAADAFARFERAGLLDRTTGRDLRHWIFEPGNRRDPQDLLSGFLGRPPTVDALLRRNELELDG